MLPTDLELARFCSAIYTNALSFDFVDEGTETGIFFAVKKLPDVDVVVFRGSTDAEDWWRDLDVQMVFEYGLGNVHAGFDKNIGMVYNLLNDKLRPHPIITGHSLGAARAAIYSGFLTHYNNSPSAVALFGCPRAGAQALASATKDIPISSYRNRQDPVTDTPLTLPNFPYVQIRELKPLDGMVENEYNDLFKDHHIDCYVNGMEKLSG